MAALGVGLPILILLALIGLGVWIAGWGVADARKRWIQAAIVFAHHGLFPAIVAGKQLNQPQFDERTATAQAVFDGNVNRINAGSARAAFTPVDETLALEAPPPAELPTEISAYSAPLPDRPALLLGQTAEGPLWFELGRSAGHILIGASSGTGKTNLEQAIMVDAARYDPRGERIQFAVVDLKEMDFAGVPSSLAQLRWPIAYNPEDGLRLLEQIEEERQQRSRAIAAAGFTALEDYNARSGAQPIPNLVAILDEISGFALHPDRRVGMLFESLLQSIVEKGVAAGVFVVLSTQRVSARVITPSITGVCDTRIAFGVPTNVESRMILDTVGAENLPDIKGRFIYRKGRTLSEAQAYYAYGREGRFAAFCASQPQRLALPADAEADGLNAFDAPSGPSEALQATLSAPNPPKPATIYQQAREALPEVPRSVADINARQADLLFKCFAATRDERGVYSFGETQRRIWGTESTGGSRHPIFTETIKREAARRGYSLAVVTGVGVRMEKKPA